jgi:hypothetical protein
MVLDIIKENNFFKTASRTLIDSYVLHFLISGHGYA